jgi:hypothetical protein
VQQTQSVVLLLLLLRRDSCVCIFSLLDISGRKQMSMSCGAV